MEENKVSQFMQPTRFDLALASIFPRWAANRQRARREFAYEAATNTRLRNSAKRLQGPEDYTAFPDRLQLIRQMRDLVQNFGLFRSMIEKLTTYAFGTIRFQAHVGDKATNDLYEEYLEGCFRSCDISGRHNLRSLTGIAFKSQLTDGDYLEQIRRDPFDGMFKLVGIEGDRLGGIVMANPSENYLQGIFIDPETGKPVSYKVWRRTKANAYVDPVEIPAMDCIHFFDPDRIDQYRGITPFASVINEARDLKEVLEACLIGTKFENYHAAIGYTESGQPLGNPGDYFSSSETLSNGTPLTEQQIKYGVIQWAPNNAKMEFLKSERPSANFQQYLETLIRLISTALNLPYGFVYNLSGLAGPAVRMDATQADRTINWHRQNMIDRRLDRIKNLYLVDGISKGIIPYTPDWFRGEWQFPAKSSIDAGRESAAAVNEVKAGLRSKADWFAENGQDAEEQESVIVDETRRTLTNAKQISDDLDVPLPVVMTMLEVRTPNGFLFQSAPGATPMDPSSDQTDGNSNDQSSQDQKQENNADNKVIKLSSELYKNREARQRLIKELGSK